jgi:hypothetical protein
MKRTKDNRRVDALARLKQSTWENAKARRRGTMTREEWQARKDADIRHLEAMHGIKPQAGV